MPWRCDLCMAAHWFDPNLTPASWQERHLPLRLLSISSCLRPCRAHVGRGRGPSPPRQRAAPASAAARSKTARPRRRRGKPSAATRPLPRRSPATCIICTSGHWVVTTTRCMKVLQALFPVSRPAWSGIVIPATRLVASMSSCAVTLCSVRAANAVMWLTPGRPRARAVVRRPPCPPPGRCRRCASPAAPPRATQAPALLAATWSKSCPDSRCLALPHEHLEASRLMQM